MSSVFNNFARMWESKLNIQNMQQKMYNISKYNVEKKCMSVNCVWHDL